MIAIYDWILTVSDEIRVIWARKMTGAKVLFLLNRYLWIASSVVSVLADHLGGIGNSVSILIWIHDIPRALTLKSLGVRVYHTTVP